MNNEYTLEQCAKYFLDILSVNPGQLPGRAEGHWEDLIEIAAGQGIYHYMAAWILEYWDNSLSMELKENLKRDLSWNRARNICLSGEIAKLANTFRAESIPVLFLKGSAGLARGLYPLEQRYISDIDIMAEKTDIDKIDRTLRSLGYNHSPSRFYKNHHHTAPWRHEEKIGDIEIHFEPYHHCFENSIIEEIRNSSETVSFYSEPVTVPSITDHVWILLRKDLIDKILLPRLSELFEIDLVRSSKDSVDFDIIRQRAIRENIPNIINKNSLYSSKFLGSCFSPSADHSDFKSFDREIFQFLRIGKPEKVPFMHCKLFIAAVRYLSDTGIKNRIKTFSEIIRSYNKSELFKLALPRSGIKKHFLNVFKPAK